MPKLSERQLLMLCGGLVTVWVLCRYLANRVTNKTHATQGIAVGEVVSSDPYTGKDFER